MPIPVLIRNTPLSTSSHYYEPSLEDIDFLFVATPGYVEATCDVDHCALTMAPGGSYTFVEQ